MYRMYVSRSEAAQLPVFQRSRVFDPRWMLSNYLLLQCRTHKLESANRFVQRTRVRIKLKLNARHLQGLVRSRILDDVTRRDALHWRLQLHVLSFLSPTFLRFTRHIFLRNDTFKTNLPKDLVFLSFFFTNYDFLFLFRWSSYRIFLLTIQGGPKISSHLSFLIKHRNIRKKLILLILN